MLGKLNGYYNDYNADGMRQRRRTGSSSNTTGETWFTYDGTQLRGTGSNIRYVYDQTGIRGMIHGDESYCFEKNALGDVIAIYNAEGDKLGSYAYDAWGNCKVTAVPYTLNGTTYTANNNSHIAKTNPFRYRGYYWDDKLQMYYLQTRFYDPYLRRFINADSTDYLDPTVPGGLNLFSYCNNNPVAKRNVAVGNTNFAVKNNGIIGDTTMIASKKSDFVFANHVMRGHHSTSVVPDEIIGTLFGNITFSTTTSDRSQGLFYSFTDQGINDVAYGAGVNFGGWLGFEAYVSTTGNIGVGVQLTPWFHFNSELGLNGLSLGVGIDNGLVSNDVMVNIGAGTIVAGILVVLFGPIIAGALAGLGSLGQGLPFLR
jgi:RHS repeat-associated protein